MMDDVYPSTALPMRELYRPRLKNNESYRKVLRRRSWNLLPRTGGR